MGSACAQFRTLAFALRLLQAALFVAIGLVFCLSPAMAQPVADCPPAPKTITPELYAAAAEQVQDRGFVWRIRKGGHSSFLYGTLHVGRKAWLAPGPLLQAALRDSTTLALELDPLDPAVGAAFGEVLAREPVRSIAPSLKARLLRQLRLQCMSIEMIFQLPAELVLANLSLAMARRDALDPTFGSETVLAQMAHARGVPVVSLETAEVQMNAVLAADAAEAQHFLEDGLREMESGHARESLLELVTMWETGNVELLDTYEQWCECVVTATEKLQMRRLVDERNPAMARKIDALHQAGEQVLAAIGSLHMAGPRGLPALLAQMGYTVERLSP